jgi:very-short-patch-repair endonuclease
MKNLPKVITARLLKRGQTNAENRLWAELRKLRSNGLRFRRQHPIGEYIVDFICLEKKLIIEVDGGQHNIDSTIIKDKSRTEWLKSEGYRVLRLWNNDVLTNIEGVITRILQEESVSPSPNLSPSGRGTGKDKT